MSHNIAYQSLSSDALPQLVRDVSRYWKEFVSSVSLRAVFVYICLSTVGQSLSSDALPHLVRDVSK
jgi:hypothetical protein